jgi:hypothetical protein
VTTAPQASTSTCGWPPGDVRQAIEDAAVPTDPAPDGVAAAAVAEDASWYVEVEFAEDGRLTVVGDDHHAVWVLFFDTLRFLAMARREPDGSWSAPTPLTRQPALEVPPQPLEIAVLDVSVGTIFAAGWAERRAILVPSPDDSDTFMALEGDGNPVEAPFLDVLARLAGDTSVPATVSTLVASTMDAVMGR